MEQFVTHILLKLLVILELGPDIWKVVAQDGNYQNYPGAGFNNAAQSQFIPVLYPNRVQANVYPYYNSNQGQLNSNGYNYNNYPNAATAPVKCLSGAGSGICAGDGLQAVNAPPVDTNRVAGGPLYQFEQQAQYNQPFVDQGVVAQPFNADGNFAQAQVSNQAALDRIIDRTGVRPPTNMHYYPMSAGQFHLSPILFMIILLLSALQYFSR